MIEKGFIQPQAVDEEIGIIGHVMTSMDGYEIASEYICANDFYHNIHRLIWVAISSVHAKKLTPDIMVVWREMEATKTSSNTSLYELSEMTGTHHNFVHKCMMVKEKSMQRGRIALAQKMIQEALTPGADPFLAIENDRARLDELLPAISGMVEASELVVPVITDVESAIRGESKSIYLGFNDIDAEYAYEPGELVVIGADSGTGKTAFSIQIVKRIRKRYKDIPFIFNSLEMKGKQLVSRDMASEISVSQMRLRTGRGMGLPEISKMVLLEANYQGMYVVRAKSNEELRIKVKQLRKQLGLSAADPVCVVSDYAQIMSGKSGGNREMEVASIGRGAKELAEEENVLLFLLSQMNKSAGNERPTQKNLRESSALGNDADWVMLLYNPLKNGQLEYEDGSTTSNVIEVIFDKVRFGKPGAIIKLHMSDYGLIGDMPSNGGHGSGELVLPRIMPRDITIPNTDRDNFPF